MSALLGRRDSSQKLVRAAIIVGALAAIVFFITTGRLTMLATGVGLTYFVALCYFEPMLGAVLLMLLQSGFLALVPFSIPHLQLTGSIRFYAGDIVLIVLFFTGLHRLLQRQERPLFLTPLLLFGTAVAISLIAGTMVGTTDLDAGMNNLRALSGYGFYIGLVGAIDSPRRLRWLIGIVFVIVVVSVAVQTTEVALGGRSVRSLYLGGGSYGRIEVEGAGWIPYVTNRATGYLLVGLFLALAETLWTKRMAPAAIAAMAFWGFMLALVRQWYIYIAFGTIALFFLMRKARLRTGTGFVGVAAFLAGLVAVLSSRITSYSLLDVWLARVGTISLQGSHVVGRFESMSRALGTFRQAPLLSPVFGHGAGSLSRIDYSVYYYTDIGAVNTITQYGLFGIATIIVLIVAFFRAGLRLFTALPISRDQAYVAGLLSAWVAIVVGYAFVQDFFAGSSAVGLAMACLDRLTAFSQSQAAPVVSKSHSRYSSPEGREVDRT